MFYKSCIKIPHKTKANPWVEANYWGASIKYIIKHWFCKISCDLYCSTLSKDCYLGFYPNVALYGINKTILGSDKINNTYMELLKSDLRCITNTLSLFCFVLWSPQGYNKYISIIFLWTVSWNNMSQHNYYLTAKIKLMFLPLFIWHLLCTYLCSLQQN